MKRKICIFTGTRAEYGLLKPLMDEIKSDTQLDLQIIASGMHLAEGFGNTYKEIERDGFTINEKIDIRLESDTPVGLSRSMGIGIGGYSEALMRLDPDLLVILGDRFEAFAAASSAMLCRVPIAHLNGGEATYGVVDEPIRHSITKMSHLHFTATELYRNRVIQLGEDPERVFNVGTIGLDNIRQMSLLSREELEQRLGFQFKEKNLLITYHPVTLEENTSKDQFSQILKVLDQLQDTLLIFTKANADTDGAVINQMIDDYAQDNKDKSVVFTSMGQLNYLSAMQYVDAVVGNSSSGLIEAPSFKIGTINIGDRQKGRIRAGSIIDCQPTKESIQQAMERLYSSEFQKSLVTVSNPQGDGETAPRIKKVLQEVKLEELLKKEFYNIAVH